MVEEEGGRRFLWNLSFLEKLISYLDVEACLVREMLVKRGNS